MPALIYREALDSDIAALARLRATGRDAQDTEAHWRERVSRYMKGESHPQQALPSRIVYVGVEDGTVVGFIAGHLTRRHGCEGELEWIDVIRERRRRGIATELARFLAGWFAEKKARRICVNVAPDNTPAVRFYRSLGAGALNEYWLVWDDISAVDVLQMKKERDAGEAAMKKI